MNLFKWEKIPVLLSSTFDDKDTDLYYDFDLHIEEDTGVVFQKNIPSQTILYKNARNSGIGNVWKKHYESFYSFILKYIDLKNKNICEIGSGNGVLAKKISKEHKIVCYEPNPNFELDENIILKKHFFTKNDEKFDVIICSHTLEHIENVNEFLSNIHNNLNDGGYVVMSYPNFEIGLLKNHINIFNTEHNFYFTPRSTERIFNKNYYQNCIIEKYEDHSIFTLGQKSKIKTFKPIDNDVDEIKQLIENYFINMNLKINQAISIINQRNKKIPLYIFGCHAMTSIFLYLSKLEHSMFNYILDNDPLKTNSRLYGTDIICKTPDEVSIGSVLLNGAVYHNEIKESLTQKGFSVLEWI